MTQPLFVDVFSGDLRGKPDWEHLVALGVPWHGAIVKATEGTACNTAWFAHQWAAIRYAAGPRYGDTFFRGAYHFLRFGQDGTKQADFYLRTVDAAGGWDRGDLWPIVDVELGGPNHPNQVATAQRIIDVTSRFAELVRVATGRAVMLYGNGAMRDKAIRDRMGCDWLWLPRYTATLPAEMYERAGWTQDRLVAWQYSGDGEAKLDGYPKSPPGFGEVDVSALVHPGGLEWLKSQLWAERP